MTERLKALADAGAASSWVRLEPISMQGLGSATAVIRDAAEATSATRRSADATGRVIVAAFTEFGLDRLAGDRHTYRAYPGAGHTLDFEPDRAPYLNDLLGWLSAMVRPVP